MKPLILILAALISISAQAAKSAGALKCDAVSKKTGENASFALEIEWGKKIPGAGDLPPYFEHASQQAKVMLVTANGAETFDMVFEARSGTTRCYWYKSLTGEIKGRAKIEFHSVSAQSCGALRSSATIAFADEAFDLHCH